MRLSFLKVAVACLLTVAAVPSFSQPSRFFESTWMGYDVGVKFSGWMSDTSVAGDLDGDGDLDIVTTNDDPVGRNMAVLENDGTGAYGSPTMYFGSQASSGVELIDVEGDGDLDIARSETHQFGSGSTISIFRNNGQGVFGSPETLTGFTGPRSLTVADFDADGRKDLAVVNWGYFGAGNTISILYGDSTGLFTRRATVNGTNGMSEIKAADLNADGKPDLAIAVDAYDPSGAQTKVLYAFNTGTSFASPVTLDAAPETNWAGNGAACLDIADMDNDGKPDIVFSSRRTWNGSTGGLLLFRNMGGSFAPKQLIYFYQPYSQGANSIKVADLNGDGWKDIVTAQWSDTFSGQMYVMLRAPDGSYQPIVPYPAGRGPEDIALADVDNNGTKDVLVTNYYSSEVTVHLNSGNGIMPMPPKIRTSTTSALWLDFQDADGDGDLDALTSGGALSFHRNLGNGVLAPYVSYPGQPGRTAGGGILRELNGDGIPDMLFADWNGPNGVILYVYYRPGRPNGTFGDIENTLIGGNNPNDLDAIDLDHDGDVDIVEAVSENGFRIGLNDGTGHFEQRFIPLDDEAEHIAFGDFNRDGHVDIAFNCYSPYGYQNAVRVVLGNGNGTFQPNQTYQVDDGPWDITAGDFNGDGILDLATCNRGFENDETPSLSVLVGNANGTFQFERRITHSAIDEPTAIHAADVDNDGKVDLLVSQSCNDIAFLKGKGDATFERQVRIGVGISPHAFQYKDITGDGTKDIGAVTQTLLFAATDLVVMKGRPGMVSLQPNDMTVLNGQILSGNLASVLVSDDQRLHIGTGPTTAGALSALNAEFLATAPSGTCTALELKLEAQSAPGNFVVSLEAYDYAAGAWVLVDARGPSINMDSTLGFVLPNPARFVEPGTRRIRARIRLDAFDRLSGSRAVYKIDQIGWRFTP